MVTKRERGKRNKLVFWDEHTFTTNYKTDNKRLLYSTGKCIQYLIVTYNGKESEKCIYFMYVIHKTESFFYKPEIF